MKIEDGEWRETVVDRLTHRLPAWIASWKHKTGATCSAISFESEEHAKEIIKKEIAKNGNDNTRLV